MLRSMLRFVSGSGGGIEVSEILQKPTHGHHWKEFSRRELKSYFEYLNPDFLVTRIENCSFRLSRGSHSAFLESLRRCVELLPVFKNGLFAEIVLSGEKSGL
jgi:2-polyprenyl-6-hydroxyphenyl methylase/3-demethylubiquinone-9 3-methyltransferase